MRVSRFLIGRDARCQLRPSSDFVSKLHCAIEVSEDKVVLRDLGSRNGTFHNGEQVTKPVQLKAGDEVRIGPLFFEIKITGVKKKRRSEELQSDAAMQWLVSEESGIDEAVAPSSHKQTEMDIPSLDKMKAAAKEKEKKASKAAADAKATVVADNSAKATVVNQPASKPDASKGKKAAPPPTAKSDEKPAPVSGELSDDELMDAFF